MPKSAFGWGARLGAPWHGDRPEAGQIALVNSRTEALLGYNALNFSGNRSRSWFRIVPRELSRTSKGVFPLAQSRDGMGPLLNPAKRRHAVPVEIGLKPSKLKMEPGCLTRSRDISANRRRPEDERQIRRARPIEAWNSSGMFDLDSGRFTSTPRGCAFGPGPARKKLAGARFGDWSTGGPAVSFSTKFFPSSTPGRA